MKTAIKQWLDTCREKHQEGELTDGDFLRLESLLAERKQMVLYLYSKSTNMRSPIASWALYDPTKPDEPTLPSQEDTIRLSHRSGVRRLADRSISYLETLPVFGYR